MKNILVLTDFSSSSQSAAEYATHLAIVVKANILLCHALEITEQLTYPLEDHLILKNKSIKRLKEVGIHLKELCNQQDNEDAFCPTISYISDLDMLAEVAEKIVGSHSIDFVIIGSAKANGLERFFFGSHTNNILDNIQCPVLLVPENLTFKQIRAISYASDFTFNNTQVITYLAELATLLNAEISVNHISPLNPPLTIEELEYSVIQEINGIQLSYKSIKNDSVLKGLIALSDSEKVDILVLVHKRYDFFESIFHSSISKQLAHSTRVPLLIMPYSYSLNNKFIGCSADL